MRNLVIIIALIIAGCTSTVDNKTDISLQLKDSKKQESEIVSETSDFYAVENEWIGLRL